MDAARSDLVFGTIGLWWRRMRPTAVSGAASEIALATRPVLVASIDDVIDRCPRRGNELELLAAVREEMDLIAIRARRRR